MQKQRTTEYETPFFSVGEPIDKLFSLKRIFKTILYNLKKQIFVKIQTFLKAITMSGGFRFRGVFHCVFKIFAELFRRQRICQHRRKKPLFRPLRRNYFSFQRFNQSDGQKAHELFGQRFIRQCYFFLHKIPLRFTRSSLFFREREIVCAPCFLQIMRSASLLFFCPKTPKPNIGPPLKRFSPFFPSARAWCRLSCPNLRQPIELRNPSPDKQPAI